MTNKEFRNKVLEYIGEYSATVMVENPAWVFNPDEAIILEERIFTLSCEWAGMSLPNKDSLQYTSLKERGTF